MQSFKPRPKNAGPCPSQSGRHRQCSQAEDCRAQCYSRSRHLRITKEAVPCPQHRRLNSHACIPLAQPRAYVAAAYIAARTSLGYHGSRSRHGAVRSPRPAYALLCQPSRWANLRPRTHKHQDAAFEHLLEVGQTIILGNYKDRRTLTKTKKKTKTASGHGVNRTRHVWTGGGADKLLGHLREDEGKGCFDSITSTQVF